MGLSFLERLSQGPILCDGAMGTMLYARGIPYERCFDELNLWVPDLVRGIHLDYIRAGAEIIETNSFGANVVKLAEHGLGDRVREINRKAVEIARQAREVAGRPVFIAGSVGPLGKPLAPLGTIKPAEARAAFQEQVEALCEAGADLLILETFYDLEEMCQAVKAARAVCQLPIVAQMTFTEEGVTLTGNTPAEIVSTLEELRVDVIGANCSVGSQPMLAVMKQMLALSHTPLSAQPNAGFPAFAQGRYVYTSSPEYMAEHARQMVELGVRVIGGCCGTTPQHIARMKEALQGVRPAPPQRISVTLAREERQPSPPPPPPLTPLAQKLGRKFVITVEVDPPRSFDARKVLDGATMLKEVGVDAIDVADSPRAQARMSALVLSALIQRHAGIETILHLATRHRNLVALHSQLIGAHALGLRNIFVVMGDLPHIGDYPDATAVSDITASGLIQLINNFNRGVDLTGKPLEEPTSFVVGCALDLGAEDLDREIRVLKRKVQAGARFALTQPVYDPATVERFLTRLGDEFPIPVIMGVLPLRSGRHAEFLHNEVPGIVIPEPVRERVGKAGKAAPQVGIELAVELIEAVKDSVAGVYFMPPFERYEVVPEIMAGLGLPEAEAA